MAATAIAPREWDAQGNPVQQSDAPRVREWNAAGMPLAGPGAFGGDSAPVSEPDTPTGAVAPQESAFGELVDIGRLLPSLIHARMIGTDPKLAYKYHEYIKGQLSSLASDFSKRVSDAATVKDDPLYMLMKHKGPEPFESHDMLLNFIHDVSEFAGDPALYGPAIAGTLLGSPRLGAAGGFALDAALRKTLTDHYQKGDIKNFGELATRTSSALWEAAKGAAIGEAMSLAGGLPVPQAIGKLGATALRGLYQASAMEIAGSILNWHAPTLESFERNAVMVGGFGLITHGVSSVIPDSKQALMDVYAKDGTKPEETATKIAAQPPVKPEMKLGLQPAIKLTAKDGSPQVISGEDATHSDLAQRVTGNKPVTIDELNADPKLADKVLNQPEIQVQQVIDRAMELKEEQPPISEREQKVSDYIDKLFTARARSEMVKGRMDDLEESEADPRPIMEEFWDKTFDALDDRGRKQFLHNFERQMGLKPGDTIVVTKDVESIKAGDWRDITDNFFRDTDKFEGLEQNEQAVTALADMLNAQRRKSEQQAPGLPDAEASVTAGSDTAPLRKKSWDERLLPFFDPNRPSEPPKSGRGFQTTDGKFLNRKQAEKWVKENEPDVHEMWQSIAGEKGEFHSADYQEARKRVADRNLMEGEPKLSGVSQELTSFLAKNRSELNDIKAGNKSDGYGKEVIRTLFTGPRNAVRAQAEQVAGRIAKLIPNYVDQEALSFMRDYRDNPDELRQEIEDIRNGNNEKLKAAIPSMERALEPTPQMLQADKMLTDYFTQANQLRSQFVGVDSSIDPARYSPRNFIRIDEESEQASGVGQGKFSKRSPHDIRREYLRLLDPLKSGEVEARTFNAVDELRVYGDRLGTSVARNVFEMELKNSELGKHGVPGQIPPELRSLMADTGILSQKELEELGAIPKNWVELPGTGKTIVRDGKQFHIGLQVPPKIAEAIKPILDGDTISGAKYWKVAKLAQAYIKSIELGLSPFHMRALTISFMNNAGIDAYRNALTSDNKSPEFEAQERNGALYGLTTTKTTTPYEAYQGLKPSSVGDRSTLLEAVRKGYEPVDKIFKGMTKATFEVVQRKFKVIDFSTKEAQWLAKHPNATDAEYGIAMRGIAKEVNAVYGGLNWEVMGVSANFQAIARMFLLAPDWTFSNVANLKYAGEGGPGGNAARAFWIKSFATGYAMTQGMSLMLTGQMSKQPFSVYLGKDDKGKEMYSSIFLAGAPKDAVGLMTKVMKDGFPTGAVEFSINKASPLFGVGARMLLNKDWQGKPITKGTDTGLEKTGKELAFGAGQLFPAPFVVKDITERLMNPDEDLTYKDFIAALVGASVYHEGSKQGKGFTLPGAAGGSKRKGFHLAGAR